MSGYSPEIRLDGLGILSFKGTIDATPNQPLPILFPKAEKGDVYIISASGIIGQDAIGGGLEVSEGDQIQAIENNEGGFYAAVLGSWSHLQQNPKNTVEILRLATDNLNPILRISFRRNTYQLINKNLIATDALFITPVSDSRPININQIGLKLPMPISSSIRSNSTIFSDRGNQFSLEFNERGLIVMRGQFTEVNESLSINFQPYLARTPLEFSDSGF